ncbi:MAG: hypothetical protein LBV50_08380 [Novosphingobium sp.]|jgi:hypothetical protein|nr:hypothetical protein [Novosphingobium sp.]
MEIIRRLEAHGRQKVLALFRFDLKRIACLLSVRRIGFPRLRPPPIESRVPRIACRFVARCVVDRMAYFRTGFEPLPGSDEFPAGSTVSVESGRFREFTGYSFLFCPNPRKTANFGLEQK